MQSVKLRSGFEMPMIGLGTWRLTGETCRKAVETAIELGYTHIDTAAAYDNEAQIGEALERCGVNRRSLFLTTKVWYENLKYVQVIGQCEESLHKLRTDYLDLLLIHWPNRRVPLRETFQAMERLVQDGKVRSVGVSNFTVHHLRDALQATELPISVNQVEFHARFRQDELLEFCGRNNILLTAYSPLGRGAVVNEPVVIEIARSKQTGVTQVALRWLIQKGIAAVPKASSPDHLRANLESLSIQLTKEEMARIDALNSGIRLIKPSWSEFDYQ